MVARSCEHMGTAYNP